VLLAAWCVGFAAAAGDLLEPSTAEELPTTATSESRHDEPSQQQPTEQQQEQQQWQEKLAAAQHQLKIAADVASAAADATAENPPQQEPPAAAVATPLAAMSATTDHPSPAQERSTSQQSIKALGDSILAKLMTSKRHKAMSAPAAAAAAAFMQPKAGSSILPGAEAAGEPLMSPLDIRPHEGLYHDSDGYIDYPDDEHQYFHDGPYQGGPYDYPGVPDATAEDEAAATHAEGRILDALSGYDFGFEGDDEPYHYHPDGMVEPYAQDWDYRTAAEDSGYGYDDEVGEAMDGLVREATVDTVQDRQQLGEGDVLAASKAEGGRAGSEGSAAWGVAAADDTTARGGGVPDGDEEQGRSTEEL